MARKGDPIVKIPIERIDREPVTVPVRRSAQYRELDADARQIAPGSRNLAVAGMAVAAAISFVPGRACVLGALLGATIYVNRKAIQKVASAGL